MGKLVAAILTLIVGVIHIIKAYNIDIIEVGSNSTMPDVLENEWQVVRPSRGVFGMSGYIDLKEDINTDLLTLEVKIFYSPNGISYKMSPFRIPAQPLTQALNRAYKDYLMEAMTKCCTNAPEAEVFVSPLTKRLIECDSCLFPSDNFPSSMRPGYYRLIVMAAKNLDTAACSILLKVELDN